MSMNTNQVLQDVTVEMTAEQEACRKAEKRRQQEKEKEEEKTETDKKEAAVVINDTIEQNTADSNNIASNHAVSNCADTELTDNESNVIEEDSKLPEKTADVSSEFPPKFATGDLELETEKTAEAADADSILKPRDKWSEDTAEMESPNREIQEMLNAMSGEGCGCSCGDCGNGCGSHDEGCECGHCH